MRQEKQLKYYYYGFGNFGIGMVMQYIASYLVFFSTVVLNLPGTFVGLIIGLTVIWDAVSDPIMGYISDVTHSKKYGRRHIYILVGSIGTAVFNILLWSIQNQWSVMTKMIIFTATLFLIKTFFTVYATPYTALGAELSKDYNIRTKIQSIKTVFFTLGLAFTTVGGMLFFFKEHPDYPTGQYNPYGYIGLAIVTSILMIVSAGVTYIKTFEDIPNLPKDVVSVGEEKVGLIKRYRYALKNKDYLAVMIAYLSANTATALIASLGLHVFTYTFQMSNNEIGFIFGVLFLLSVLSQPLWLYLSKRLEKNGAAKVAVLFSIGGALVFILLVFNHQFVADHTWIMLVYTLLSGIGTGGLLTIPLSMVADTIDEEEVQSGKRMEGVYYGGLTFSYKLAQSITIFAAGIILDLIRFNPDIPVQPEQTMIGLGLVLGIGGLLALVVTYIAYHYYTLDQAGILKIQSQLESQTKN